MVVALLLAFAFSEGKLSVAKICCLRGKIRDKYVCHRRMINQRGNGPGSERRAERGNFVCIY